MPLKENPEPAKKKRSLREKMFLANQASSAGLKVLPSDRWALHYKKDGAERAEILRGLLSGKFKPAEVAEELRPDAILYDSEDLETDGMESVSNRIRDISGTISNYDYIRFADFVSRMKGRTDDIELAQALYDGIIKSRIRKKLLDAYGSTGRRQMLASMKNEAKRSIRNFREMDSLTRVLEALKLNWMAEDLRLIDQDDAEKIIADLSEDESKIYEKLKSSYAQFVQNGGENSYQELMDFVRDQMPEIEKTQNKASESMQELQEELEQYEDKVGPPGTAKDPAIPYEDRDEYHTPPPPPDGADGGEGAAEKMKSQPIFVIEPVGKSKYPLAGEYCSGRKSYYDVNTKTWSKKKVLKEYSEVLKGEDRQKISRKSPGGLESIPLPAGYGLDVSTLKYTGAKPKIHRDQNGCFYAEMQGDCEFSVEFLKEDKAFGSNPIKEDTQRLYNGLLSAETEAQIASLKGSALDKAIQARNYIQKKHYYPGGGDLKAAQALQYKLRTESTGANYIQNLDASEYLECYSSNTLFIAMLRKAGIPARLVIGHKVEGAKNGKSVIDTTTGHAWAEIWDGSTWRRVDATPAPKPQDKKKEDKKSENGGKKTPTEKADDGGVDQKEMQDEVGDKVQEKMEDFEDAQAGEPGEASDSEMNEASEEMSQTEQAMEKMEQKKSQLKKEMQQMKDFKDMKNMEEKIDEADLLDEMKKELENELEAREEGKKEELQQKLDQLAEDGFIDEEKKKEMEKILEEGDLLKLDQLLKQVEREGQLHDEYEAIKEEVMPLVERWFRYFVEKLPRVENPDFDEDSLTRSGSFDRHSVFKPRNLLFGTVRNPRIMRSSVQPKFITKITVDVSGSMAGEKLHNARKMLVFYNELFERIGKEFGYIKSSIDIFSDTVTQIKGFNQDYDSPTRYRFLDGNESTIKYRLMTKVQTAGGTNMLDAVRSAADDLNEEKFQYPDHATAFYFMGDGGDTCGNTVKIREFLNLNDSVGGFGDHIKSAILLGNESERVALAEIFGDEHTTVAGNFEELVEQSMYKFDADIENYTKNML